MKHLTNPNLDPPSPRPFHSPSCFLTTIQFPPQLWKYSLPMTFLISFCSPRPPLRNSLPCTSASLISRGKNPANGKPIEFQFKIKTRFTVDAVKVAPPTCKFLENLNLTSGEFKSPPLASLCPRPMQRKIATFTSTPEERDTTSPLPSEKNQATCDSQVESRPLSTS
jgi:hypothetical protein